MRVRVKFSIKKAKKKEEMEWNSYTSVIKKIRAEARTHIVCKSVRERHRIIKCVYLNDIENAVANKRPKLYILKQNIKIAVKETDF